MKKKSPQLKYYYKNKEKIAKKARLMRLLFKLQADIEDMDSLKKKYDDVKKLIEENYSPKKDSF